MALPPKLSDKNSVAVIFAVNTGLRLSNTSGVYQSGVVGGRPFDGADDALFEDRITGPVQIQSRISIEQYGSLIKGTESIGGSLDFATGAQNVIGDWSEVTYDMYEWLQEIWKGRTFLLYQGETGEENFDNYELVAGGIIDDLNFGLDTASVKLGGNLRQGDGPLVEEYYTSPAPSNLIGKPKPKVWGYVRNFAPVLYDEPSQTYHISTVTGITDELAAIENVSVGGIAWYPTTVIDPNVTGQYTVDLVNGTMQLSGAPGNLELRCDVKAYGWDTLTTGGLIKKWLTEKGIAYDADSFDQLDVDIPQLVGYRTVTETVNRLDAIDEVCLGMGAFLVEDSIGAVKIFAIKEPGASTDDSTYDIDGMNADGVVDFKLTRILPRVYQVLVEYGRVWDQMSTFAELVPEAQKQMWQSTGQVEGAFGDTALQDSDPSSIAAPVIRTLCNNDVPTSAVAVGFRLAEAWNPERRIYEITLTTEPPELYSNIKVNYMGIVNKIFRVISVTKNLGGNTCVIQIWG